MEISAYPYLLCFSRFVKLSEITGPNQLRSLDFASQTEQCTRHENFNGVLFWKAIFRVLRDFEIFEF